MIKTKLKVVVDIRDIEEALAARGIEEGDCSVREAMFGTDYTNDCYKSYGLDWDLEKMRAEIARMNEEDYYDNCERSCAKLGYEIQKMLQEEFPDLDSILVDVSW